MTTIVRDLLQRQFALASKLLHLHLDGLTTAECLWTPAAKGLAVRQAAQGAWTRDWPSEESYDIGPPSAGWITWHIGFWWSMVIDRTFGPGQLEREQVTWPGSAGAAVQWILDLERQWLASIEDLDDARLASTELTRWPFTDRPFADVVAWVTVELTKNAAELGMVRFLYAVRSASEALAGERP